MSLDKLKLNFQKKVKIFTYSKFLQTFAWFAVRLKNLNEKPYYQLGYLKDEVCRVKKFSFKWYKEIRLGLMQIPVKKKLIFAFNAFK